MLRTMLFMIGFADLTSDWLNDASDTIQQSKMKFEQEMSQTTPASMNYIFLQHDTRYQTCWSVFVSQS